LVPASASVLRGVSRIIARPREPPPQIRPAVTQDVRALAVRPPNRCLLAGASRHRCAISDPFRCLCCPCSHALAFRCWLLVLGHPNEVRVIDLPLDLHAVARPQVVMMIEQGAGRARPPHSHPDLAVFVGYHCSLHRLAFLGCWLLVAIVNPRPVAALGRVKGRVGVV